MKPTQRLAWIEGWLASHPHEIEVSILHQAFVDAYIEATDAKYQPTFYGAFKCPRLTQDLTALSKRGFKRVRSSLSALEGGKGWPKWVWSYPNPHWK